MLFKTILEFFIFVFSDTLIYFVPIKLNIRKLILKPSLCTDVPPPSEKIGRRDVVSSPDFFSEGGGRLYTGY